ncbi:MAG: hypothetical protein Q4Q23_05000 [Methanobacteriaceae archaeon]|nr:hypothetical protein [Methanobacteriaceae archaeon]
MEQNQKQNINKPLYLQQPKTESRTEHESTQPKEPEPKTEENTTTKSTTSTEEIAIIKKDINSTIIDTDKTIYGPFNNNDLIILPKKILKILKEHNDAETL